MKKSHPLLSTVLCLSLILLLSGCAHPPAPPSGHGGYKAYTVRGKTYRPLKSAEGFTETGMASWYGPGFHGKRTASGERFNQNSLTAAHKLLPFGTKVRVTNLSNGRETVVRINDRGPFSASRIIDVSKKAARDLGMISSGTARVHITALNDKGKPPILTPQGDMIGLFYVQAGTFRQLGAAEELAIRLRSRGYGCRTMQHGKAQVFVQLGPYMSRLEAEAAARPLKGEFGGLFIVAE